MKHSAYLVVVALLCSSGLTMAEDGKNATVKKIGSGRIVGGYAVNIANYPYTVVVNAYYSNYVSTCGGIIVASTKVLTAAHCLYQLPIRSITIRAGSSLRSSGGTLFNHLSYIVHDQYNAANFANDVAVITIRGSFNNLANVGKIVLQNTEPVISSILVTPCFVVGWGWINLNARLADTLQRGNFVLMPQTTCSSRVRGVSPTTICAQSLEGDACRGDSGGPLVCKGRLYGVVSWGPPDCNGAMPDGFAKITAPSIRSFIRTNAGV
ncbi:trypsin delta-like [Anopheles aquasalis]|uniref:trypsin delta-like n=1 Tax=Anopheles aquasalis TaxID=42839 RepID=UPI00215A1A27|nr:trypsin delta-like [Anopheles aquasalis]